MRILTIVAIIALGIAPLTAFSGQNAEEGGKALVPQKTCPIMGGAINKSHYVDVRGQRIYVCCAGCIPRIEKDPESALQKLQESGQFAESLQKTCPVMQKAIQKQFYVEHKGRRLYVCCKGCIGAVKASPEKYADKIAEAIAASEKTEQQQ